MEIWKDIKGYKGLYKISNLGNVKSLNYNKTRKEKIKKTYSNNQSYTRVHLSKNGKEKSYLVHRLVYEAFYGKIPFWMQVNHINERKNDNRLENLNLMTPKQNTNWGTHNIRCSKSLINNPKICKPVLQYDLEGNFIKEWPSMSEIERIMEIPTSNICNCCKLINKTAGGFIWKYK